MVLELMDDGNVLAVELVKLTPSQLSSTLLFTFNDLLATELTAVSCNREARNYRFLSMYKKVCSRYDSGHLTYIYS